MRSYPLKKLKAILQQPLPCSPDYVSVPAQVKGLVLEYPESQEHSVAINEVHSVAKAFRPHTSPGPASVTQSPEM